MKCSCLSVLYVCATRRIANYVALAILIGTCQLVNDILYKNVKIKTKMPPKTVTKTKTKIILKTKETVFCYCDKIPQ